MIIKKFVAANIRDALEMVREALGADALILSNRPMPGGGVEIQAVAEAEVEKATPAPQAPPEPEQPIFAPRTKPGISRYADTALADDDDDEPPPKPRSEPSPAPAVFAKSRRATADAPPPVTSAAPMPPPAAAEPALTNEPRRPRRMEPAEAKASAPPRVEPQRTEPKRGEPRRVPGGIDLNTIESVSQAYLPDEIAQGIIQEIRFLRGMVEGQLAGLAWGHLQRSDPRKLEVFRQLLMVGFSPLLSRQILEELPPDTEFEQAMQWVNTALLKHFNRVSHGRDIIAEGGVFALVGPTGVGKTTTVAKLAARCVLKHGAASVALISTDSYRIGAQDQLRIYGNILGVPVHGAKNQFELDEALEELSDKYLVLIDTVGMGQRDRRLPEQVDMLSNLSTPVQRLLLLSAVGQGATLEDVVQAYCGNGVAGCILTKIDESLSMGGALDVVVRNELALHYVTNGQRVPEDLHLANPVYLIDRAFKTPHEDSAFALRHEEYPVMAGAVPGRDLPDFGDASMIGRVQFDTLGAAHD